MGQEVVFKKDRRGNDIVDVTPAGHESVQEALADLQERQGFNGKRRGEQDMQGGKRRRKG